MLSLATHPCLPGLGVGVRWDTLLTRVCVPLWSLGWQACVARSFRASGHGQSSVQDWREVIGNGSSFLGLYTQMGTQNKTVSRQGLQRNAETGPMTLGVKWRHLSLRIHFAYKVGVSGVELMTTGLRRHLTQGQQDHLDPR